LSAKGSAPPAGQALEPRLMNLFAHGPNFAIERLKAARKALEISDEIY
jgi:hypothetical protein